MSSTQPLIITVPEGIPKETERTDGGRWTVVIYNNETTAYEAVVAILMEATGCDVQEAAIETWEAHHFGSAMVHFGSRSVCEEASAVIRTIGVRTEVRPEWKEDL